QIDWFPDKIKSIVSVIRSN
ncbi:unnamed protein product, partial [Rotaria magnacalcarata]